MRFYFLTIMLATWSLTACKSPGVQDSEAMAVSSGESSGQAAPILDLAIRGSLRRLVKEIEDRQHTFQSGAYVATVTRVTLADPYPSDNGIWMPILLSVSVRASSSQSLPLGASAGGTLSFTGVAQADIRLAASGAEPELSLYQIRWARPLVGRANVWTNARLFRGRVLSQARQSANAMIPSTRERIRREVEAKFAAQVRQAIATVQPTLEEYMSLLTEITGGIPRFSSAGGVAHMQITSPAAAEPPPALRQGKEIGVSVNQTLVEQIAARELGGKTVDPEAFRSSLCEISHRSHLEMCRPSPLSDYLKIDLQFPDEPLEATFDGDAVALTTRFKIKATTTDALGLTLGPWQIGAEGIVHITPTITAKVPYAKGARQFQRGEIEVVVEEVENSDTGVAILLEAAYREALTAAVKGQLTDILPEWIGLPAVPVFATTPSSPVDARGSFVLMDPRKDHGTSSGWLYGQYSHCSLRSLANPVGMTVDLTKDSEGNPLLWVKKVIPSSEATRAKVLEFGPGYDGSEVVADYDPGPGMQVGDVIYSVDGDRGAVVTPQTFEHLVSTRSLIPGRNVLKLKVGRKVKFPAPAQTAWINIDYEIPLTPVCKDARLNLIQSH